MINALFPFTDYKKLEADKEGLYSITNFNEAEQITKLILEYFTDNTKLNILDCTGGLGGNTINFSKYFLNVTSLEINLDRCNMLKNNIGTYNLKNIKVLNCDSINFLYTEYNNYDIYFIDPPWGGPNYKKYQNISLKLGNKYLLEIANFLKNICTNKLLVFKLPYNYNFKEFINFNYKLHKIKNYYITVISI